MEPDRIGHLFIVNKNVRRAGALEGRFAIYSWAWAAHAFAWATDHVPSWAHCLKFGCCALGRVGASLVEG